MNFNKILQSLFGNKSTRDMKLIQPIVQILIRKVTTTGFKPVTG